MKFLALCILSLAVIPAARAEVAGHWEGKGYYITADDAREVSVDLVIEATADVLSIRECFLIKGLPGNPKCLSSQYALENETQVYLGDRRLGDYSPWDLTIIDGHAQVAEQMTARESKGQLHWRYTYMNYDGASELRDATLSRAPQ